MHGKTNIVHHLVYTVCLEEKKRSFPSLKVCLPLLLSVNEAHNEHPRVVLSHVRAQDLSEGEGQEGVPITSQRGRAVIHARLVGLGQTVAL